MKIQFCLVTSDYQSNQPIISFSFFLSALFSCSSFSERAEPGRVLWDLDSPLRCGHQHGHPRWQGGSLYAVRRGDDAHGDDDGGDDGGDDDDDDKEESAIWMKVVGRVLSSKSHPDA